MPPQQKPQDPALLDGASSRFADAFLRRTTQGRPGGGPGPRPVTWIVGAAGATAAVVLIVFAVAKVSSGHDGKTRDTAAVSASPTPSGAERTTPAKTGATGHGPTGGATKHAGGTKAAGGGSGSSGGGSGRTGGAAAPVAGTQSGSGTGTGGSSTTSGGSGSTQTQKSTQSTQVAGYPGVTVVGHASGRCVSATGHQNSKATDGTPLEIHDCDGGSWQKVDFRSDGTARMYGLCMDIAGADKSDGTTIQLAKCNGGWAQKFIVNTSYDLVNTSIGKCVDVVDSNTGNGTRLQLWDCAGTPNQKWTKK
ncbi:Ricin-type beta-trefoil lectin domain-containing protein [Actinacidiphila yanglinensis]|uniref:Ricin-type beta-trefoil lectin domain-containing protein n=1 Tax=Actinacidiphila yanglinensis TaxID=310779 RepID=A0A1H6E412_9ACTN|nr:RICIN domain-containing protein [Actinacidiphila yanglinensis]SEG92009.1 Ricin-type beta-trefoil lectin domain-containing protein [Actinacidiphila yanglinensis]